MPSDHDRIIRLEAELRALNRLNDERDALLVQRYDLGEKTITAAVEALHSEYKMGHEALTARVDKQAQVLAGFTGTATGRNSLIVFVALGISFITLLGGLVDLLLRD